jgi:hypothetical protein
VAAAAETYDEQQRRLRQEQGIDDDGEPDFNPEDLRIPDINPEIYKDVEPILFQGFVTVAATINDVTFVFKSLNHHEFGWLAMMNDLKSGDAEAARRYSNMFLAYGVFAADGVNVLKDRDESVAELMGFFAALPKDAKQKVVRHLSEINRRANRAVLLVEPYIMENKSKLRWAQVKGLDLSATAVTGFEGTASLGLNWGQLTWRALNHFEDLRENSEREWENAKFIASSMAGKGMSKVYSSDRRRRQSERDEKIERREKVIRFALFNESLEAKSQGDRIVARTVAELTDQLEKDLTGEKDWHDRVIADHEGRIRQDMDRRAEEIRRARDAHLREFGDRPVIAGTDIRGLSKRDVEERMRARQTRLEESLEARLRHPELTDPKYEEFASKWLQKPIVRNAPSVMPVQSAPRPRTNPFKRDS